MKIVVIGDIHGEHSWKRVLDKEKEFDRVIFIGDYVDSFTVKAEQQLENLKDIIQYRKDNPDKVELLLGNHDLSYWRGFMQTCSGYQHANARAYELIYEANRQYFKIATYQDNILFTHAGVTKSFLQRLGTIGTGRSAEGLAIELNSKFAPDPDLFGFVYGMGDYYGNHPDHSCVWVRPTSLLVDQVPNVTQVVGHTTYRTVEVLIGAEGKQVYFVDTLPHEYLVIEDGQFNIKEL